MISQRSRRAKKIKNDLSIEDIISQAGSLGGADISGDTIMMRRLGRGPIRMLVVIFIVIGGLFIISLVRLSLSPTQQYERMLYRNRLASEIVFAPRGAIVDRYGNNFASSSYNPVTGRYEREVSDIPGIGSLIGFIRYPEKDSSGFFWRFSTEGASGLEKLADLQLREYPGYRLTTRERQGEEVLFPEDRVVYPRAGQPLYVTLDYALTKQLGESLSSFITKNKYEAGAGAVMNVRTGELLAMVSLPDIDADAMSRNDPGVIDKYLADEGKPMLNRVLFGGYSPGSTIKPYAIAAFLSEGIITPQSTVDSTGSIKVINPYTKGEDYTFRDWREEGHGITNARWALADSVNTFFYTYGGGYGGKKGIGIKKLKEYMQKFGLGEPVPFIIKGTQPGQIPDPNWKLRTFGETWRLGDTYNSSIGQYGFVVTPMQQLRAIAALATSGLLIKPILLSSEDLSVDRITGIEERWFEEIRLAMREVVTKGTGQSMNVPEVEFAAKTGTAQVANKTKINSWAVGFWPYNDPQYAFVVLAERGPKTGAPNVSHAWRDVIDWMIDERTEYFIPAAGYEDVKASEKVVRETGQDIQGSGAEDTSDDAGGENISEDRTSGAVEVSEAVAAPDVIDPVTAVEGAEPVAVP